MSGERHAFAPSTSADRCAECNRPSRHPNHTGQRPAHVCTMRGPHNAHGACPGVDFPRDFAPASHFRNCPTRRDASAACTCTGEAFARL